ncbi:hypothetical protein Tco_0397891 [Tanacetum coccineum]
MVNPTLSKSIAQATNHILESLNGPLACLSVVMVHSCKFIQRIGLSHRCEDRRLSESVNDHPNCVIALRCLRKLRDKIHSDVVPFLSDILGDVFKICLGRSKLIVMTKARTLNGGSRSFLLQATASTFAFPSVITNIAIVSLSNSNPYGSCHHVLLF